MTTSLKILNRSCGECTACCTACAVVELQKPANTSCQHICERGCGIYETRPQSCRDYHCIWLTGGLPEKFRPDQCGYVFSHPEQQPPDRIFVECTVMTDNFDLARIQYLFDKMRASWNRPAHLVIYPKNFTRPIGNVPTIGKRVAPNIQIAVGVANR